MKTIIRDEVEKLKREAETAEEDKTSLIISRQSYVEKFQVDHDTLHKQYIEFGSKNKELETELVIWKENAARHEADYRAYVEQVEMWRTKVEYSSELNISLEARYSELEKLYLENKDYKDLYLKTQEEFTETNKSYTILLSEFENYKIYKETELQGLRENIIKMESDYKLYRSRFSQEFLDDEINIFKKKLYNLEDESKELNKTSSYHFSENRSLKIKIESLESANLSLSSQISMLSESAVEYRENIQKLEEDYRLSQNKFMSCENEIKFLIGQNQKNGQLMDQEENNRKLQLDIKFYVEKSVVLENEANVFKEKFLAGELNVKKLKEKISALESEMNSYIEKCSIYEEDVKSYKYRMNSALEELEIMKGRYLESEDKVDYAKAKLDSIEKDNNEIRQKYLVLESEISEYRFTISKKDEHMMQFKLEIANLKEEVSKRAIFETETRFIKKKFCL